MVTNSFIGHSNNQELEVPKKSPVLLIVAGLTFALLLGFSFYLYLQKSAINEEKKHLTDQVSSIKTEIAQLEGQKIQAAQVAQESMAMIKKQEVLWSNVLTKIKSLVPQGVDGSNKIEFLSYSGSGDGKLSLNAQTKPSKVEPYGDVSDLLSAFNNSSYFANAIVPNITRGENDAGDKTLSFTFNLDYKEKSPEELKINN